MSSNENTHHPLRRWLARGTAIALVLAILAFVLRNLVLGAPVQTREAVRGDIVQTVVASGRVMTPRRVSVGVVLTGRVARIPVTEGQSVRQGEILIVLDDQDERAALAQARAAVVQAETRIRQLRELGLPAAEQTLLQAQANAISARQQYERNKELKAKGFVSQSVLDDAQRTLDVAESQLRAARLQVRASSPKGSDYRLAQAALEQAQAVARAAEVRLEHTVVSAPVAGTLIARGVEVGDVVQPGKTLMVLAPAGETQIVVQIDERNLGQLKLGQQALASADAYPQERFEAELFYVNPGIDALRGSVEVKLRVPRPPDYLRQDMTVSVDIEVGRRVGTIVVAADAVHDGAGAQPWVLAIEEQRVRRRAVKLGMKGESRVEILEGVAPGERLISTASGAVRDGQRVRAAARPGDAAP